ncbi:protein dehydratase [Falsigemmobacter faecalis]|uniref:Protein dehydratase n=1 Tax=Falsigemmobacter faecalis TaxID=2488730 RepID=A0A3P3DRL5_9RHOB|nr:protein dehydratase [Falsigemmobacter faecalis]RRH76182.1 protein dehydratase [Falsigemmobacter faecalis]
MSELTLDPDVLRGWVGRRETAEDSAGIDTFARVAALFDLAPLRQGEPLPELWHWFLFPPKAAQSDLGPDGHPRLGGFLPPFALPRRMWGGSGVAFCHPLRNGLPVRRETVIEQVDLKQARSGVLGIVRLRHDLHQDGRLCLTETQDLIYRAAAMPGDTPAAPQPATDDAQAQRVLTPDPVLLFRYSALTWNAHRIHYDLPWATGEEGYPGLVVHGPLTATLLAAHARAVRQAPLRKFRFRGLSPLFCNEALSLNACEADGALRLWASGPRGGVSMSAEAGF